MLDVFSTERNTSALLIEFQFGQLGPPQQTLVRYNSKMLNDSYDKITTSIDEGRPVSEGFLMGRLKAWNATEPNQNGTADASADDNAGNDKSRPNTALAMYVFPFSSNESVTQYLSLKQQDSPLCNYRLRVCLVLRCNNIRGASDL